MKKCSAKPLNYWPFPLARETPRWLATALRTRALRTRALQHRLWKALFYELTFSTPFLPITAQYVNIVWSCSLDMLNTSFFSAYTVNRLSTQMLIRTTLPNILIFVLGYFFLLFLDWFCSFSVPCSGYLAYDRLLLILHKWEFVAGAIWTLACKSPDLLLGYNA